MNNYSENTKALIWLNSFDQISPNKRNRILELASEPAKLYRDIRYYQNQITEISSSETYDRFANAGDNAYMEMLLSEIERYKIEPVGITDDKYPNMLKEIDTPPILLYCRGNTELFNARLMGVVGTRLPSRYGKDVTEKFVTELIKYGFSIVSGLARGIDSIAHMTALSLNSPQIAVMGCGLDMVYPAENKELATNIVKDGLVISEYRVGEKPLSFHFPERNRIISGLADGILVPEAGENSGSLITINCAIEQGRRVYIVPGNIFSKQSMGANQKLKDMQTALVTGIDDILIDYNIDIIEDQKKETVQLDINESIILNALTKEEMHMEELIKLTGLPVNNLNSILMKMELQGLIKKLYGNNYGV